MLNANRADNDLISSTQEIHHTSPERSLNGFRESSFAHQDREGAGVAHPSPRFVHKEDDLNYLFSHLHGRMQRSAYYEVRMHSSTEEILGKWPLLAEVHAFDSLENEI